MMADETIRWESLSRLQQYALLGFVEQALTTEAWPPMIHMPDDAYLGGRKAEGEQVVQQIRVDVFDRAISFGTKARPGERPLIVYTTVRSPKGEGKFITQVRLTDYGRGMLKTLRETRNG